MTFPSSQSTNTLPAPMTGRDCPEPPLDPPEPREEAGEWYYGCFIPNEREYESD